MSELKYKRIQDLLLIFAVVILIGILVFVIISYVNDELYILRDFNQTIAKELDIEYLSVKNLLVYVISMIFIIIEGVLILTKRYYENKEFDIIGFED